MALTLSMAFPSCSSIEYTADQAPQMVVCEDRTPFYRRGPAQGAGPDRYLAKGEEVIVSRKEFGYSFVTLKDGTKGYLANEVLASAPPRKTPATEPKSESISFDQEPSALPTFRY
jgi:hypothetical protein